MRIEDIKQKTNNMLVMSDFEVGTLDQVPQEAFEEARNSLTKFWRDMISEDDWKLYEKEVLNRVKDHGEYVLCYVI